MDSYEADDSGRKSVVLREERVFALPGAAKAVEDVLEQHSASIRTVHMADLGASIIVFMTNGAQVEWRDFNDPDGLAFALSHASGPSAA